MKEELQRVLDKLDDIKYGFVSNGKNIYPEDLKNWDINFSKTYRLQSPWELMKNKYGVCWDQVELERFYLNEKNINCSSYFIIAYDGKIEPTHTFIVVKKDKYYWLEHSIEKYRGVHEYTSLDELLLDVKTKFKKSIKKQKIKKCEVAIFKYEKPNYNINCIEFMKHCEKGKKVKEKE